METSNSFGSEGLDLLEYYLGLSSLAPLDDVILVSIDLEFYHVRRRLTTIAGIREVGISTFDTRMLRPNLSQTEIDGLIKTRQFPIQREPDHYYPRSRECVFGLTTAEISGKDLRKELVKAMQ
jgi:capsule polysaccharide modification protein KpsS